MMPGIRLHPRTRTVEKAEADLHTYLSHLIEDRHLTWTEAALILARLQTGVLKYALRAERHPDNPERKADEA